MKTAALPVPAARRHQVTTLDQLAAIPEEEIWLASQKSTRTRRAHRLDAAHFMRSFGITNSDMGGPVAAEPKVRFSQALQAKPLMSQHQRRKPTFDAGCRRLSGDPLYAWHRCA